MLATAQALAVRFRDRVEVYGRHHGLAYPWWVPLLSLLAQVGATALALAQRDALLSPDWVTLVLPLVAVPHVVHFVAPRWMPVWFDAPVVLASVAWLTTVPATADGAEYVVPLIAAFLAAEITIMLGARAGVATTLVTVALLVALDPGPTPGSLVTMFVLEVGVGLTIGVIMRGQMRALAAEQLSREQERERATLAERQRIAREIHDLVAHSLSVTMLHVGGARQALVAGDDGVPDVEDALAALADAEEVGRQAMAEIRRTVSVLATGPTGGQPLPGAEDIPALVAQVRDAGHPVTFAASGDPATLPAAAGLGLYRVLQESLTNATKHAPGEPVDVHFDVGSVAAHLVVRNRRRGSAFATDGSGTAGMASRAEQLGGTLLVGPDPRAADQWLVDLSVPVDSQLCRVRKVFG